MLSNTDGFSPIPQAAVEEARPVARGRDRSSIALRQGKLISGVKKAQGKGVRLRGRSCHRRLGADVRLAAGLGRHPERHRRARRGRRRRLGEVQRRRGRRHAAGAHADRASRALHGARQRQGQRGLVRHADRGRLDAALGRSVATVPATPSWRSRPARTPTASRSASSGRSSALSDGHGREPAAAQGPTRQARSTSCSALIYALLALAVIVSLFGIVNTLALSIHERTRELGMLRAVGMSRRQVRRMVRYEAVITALIGALLGTVLGRGLRGADRRARWPTRASSSPIPIGDAGDSCSCWQLWPGWSPRSVRPAAPHAGRAAGARLRVAATPTGRPPRPRTRRRRARGSPLARSWRPRRPGPVGPSCRRCVRRTRPSSRRRPACCRP